MNPKTNTADLVPWEPARPLTAHAFARIEAERPSPTAEDDERAYKEWAALDATRFGPVLPSQPPVPPASRVPIKAVAAEVPVTDVPALLDAVTQRAAQHDALRADPTPDAAVSCSPDLVARLERLCLRAEGMSAQEVIGELEGLKASIYAGLTARVAQRHTREVASHPVDLTEAASILGESADWLKHHGEEADRYRAAIRMGGERISGYDVAGLLKWRRARTGPIRR